MRTHLFAKSYADGAVKLELVEDAVDEGVKQRLLLATSGAELTTDEHIQGFLGALKAEGHEGLDRVHLSGCIRITSAGLTGLSKYGPRLRQLDFVRMEALRELRFVEDLYGLEILHLSECTGLTDESLEPLQECVHLQYLGLSKTRVMGPGLRHLRNLKLLETINLNGCVELRPSWLDVLRGTENPALRYVLLHGCPLIEAPLLEKLREVLPAAMFCQ